MRVEGCKMKCRSACFVGVHRIHNHEERIKGEGTEAMSPDKGYNRVIGVPVGSRPQSGGSRSGGFLKNLGPRLGHKE